MSEKKWLASDGKTELRPFDKVLVRNCEYEEWKCGIFSHYEDGAPYPYECVSDAHSICIPYEGNEYLLGTMNYPKDTPIHEPCQEEQQPPVKPFEWGEWVIVWNDRGELQVGIYICPDTPEGHHVILRGHRGATFWKYCKRVPRLALQN